MLSVSEAVVGSSARNMQFIMELGKGVEKEQVLLMELLAKTAKVNDAGM